MFRTKLFINRMLVETASNLTLKSSGSLCSANFKHFSLSTVLGAQKPKWTLDYTYIHQSFLVCQCVVNYALHDETALSTLMKSGYSTLTLPIFHRAIMLKTHGQSSFVFNRAAFLCNHKKYKKASFPLSFLPMTS